MENSTYYSIVSSVISQGDYDLNALIPKIDALWLSGNLTDEQHTELIQNARDNADPMVGVDLVKLVYQLGQQITEMSNRIAELEGSTDTASPEGTGENTQPGAATPVEWQDGMIVFAGARVICNGHTYECIAPDGTPCTWSPDCKPDCWQLIE